MRNQRLPGKRWLLLVALGGCLPIPWYRHAIVRPEGTVRVIDASTHGPLSGASIVLRRHSILDREREDRDTELSAQTDAAGRVVFTGLAEGEWEFPLMMHGVDRWEFDVCTAATGYRPVTFKWLTQQSFDDPGADETLVPLAEVALQPLDPGEGASCDCVATGDAGALPRCRDLDSPESIRLTFSATPPARPTGLPPTAQWCPAGRGEWVQCAALAEAHFACSVWPTGGGQPIVVGTFVRRPLAGADAPLDIYAYDFSRDQVLLRGWDLLLPDGIVRFPVIGEESRYEKGIKQGSLARPSNR